LSSSAQNLVDCAIAKVLADDLADAEFLPRVGKLTSAAPLTAAEHQQVEKVGRTTGYRRGTIIEVNATISVEYESLGVLTFDDQILITGDTGPFSAAGDSGSLIVDRNAKQGVGLLFAGSPTHTIANKLANVLSALNVDLVV
jgi:hypothetical protein